MASSFDLWVLKPKPKKLDAKPCGLKATGFQGLDLKLTVWDKGFMRAQKIRGTPEDVGFRVSGHRGLGVSGFRGWGHHACKFAL